MDAVNRLVVIVGMLLLLLASMVVLATGLGVLSPDRLPLGYWIQEGLTLLTSPGRRERVPGVFAAIGASIFALAFLWLEWRTARPVATPIVVSSAPEGDITLSRRGVERLAESVASEVDGVDDALAQVSGRDRIKVACRVRITPMSHAPTISEELRTRLKEAIEQHVGRPVASVSIHTQLDSLPRGRRPARVG